ncbi:DAK2 domain-containing protein [Effusibacillus pohliae]|uniref:DAK2 domain-containing protein n=1 Tax=Effusibacillus pohliae TaxID=232270 RepID=UPI00036057D9|nr:DAK2 domain-containing protein [Effusibacillus pohliae]
MNHKRLDGGLFVQMVLAGQQSLESNKQAVNALNVFPVPDGDTGTNMSLSLASGVAEMRRVANRPLGEVAEALATGLLMGARGNSGVILSQLFRGFAKAVSNRDSIDVRTFAECLQTGVTTAYNAVAKPVEGTILTVAKDAAKAAAQAARPANATLYSVMEAALKEAERSLRRTPDLLPVLKQANVVDSGGQGLVFIYRGFLTALSGERLEQTPLADEPVIGPIPHGMPAPAGAFVEHAEEYGYCTEFIIRLDRAPDSEQEIEQRVRNALQEYGDSMLVVAANNLVKVHIHALRPGQVLEEAIQFGPLTRIKIDNMTEQHHNLKNEYGNENPAPAAVRPYGLVAVAAGDGLRDIFKSIGVEVVEGGQTMNPSTEDIVKAVERLNAEQVFVLPNNSNIIMAAEQAKLVLGDKIRVIPTKTVPQGIAAALAFDPEELPDVNENRMQAAAGRIKTGQVTRAVRDSQFQDFDIKQGDCMGLAEGKVVAVGPEPDQTAQSLLEKMVDKDSEIITVFYGQAVTSERAEQLVDRLAEKFRHCEFELHYGGQPLYDYILSVE